MLVCLLVRSFDRYLFIYLVRLYGPFLDLSLLSPVDGSLPLSISSTQNRLWYKQGKELHRRGRPLLGMLWYSHTIKFVQSFLKDVMLVWMAGKCYLELASFGIAPLSTTFSKWKTFAWMWNRLCRQWYLVLCATPWQSALHVQEFHVAGCFTFRCITG